MNAIRITRGNPSDDELAALVTVLGAIAGAGTDEARRRRRIAWASPARGLRPPLTGANSWTKQRWLPTDRG